jgi:hypothetical protein
VTDPAENLPERGGKCCGCGLEVFHHLRVFVPDDRQDLTYRATPACGRFRPRGRFRAFGEFRISSDFWISGEFRISREFWTLGGVRASGEYPTPGESGASGHASVTSHFRSPGGGIPRNA